MKKEDPVDDSSKLLDSTSRWSIYSWAAVILGFISSKPKISHGEELGWTLIFAGVIFAIIALSTACYGIFTKKYRPALFVLPIIMSLPPIISLLWVFLGK